MTKPVVQVRRFSNGWKGQDQEKVPYLSSDARRGGTITYSVEVDGVLDGLNVEQTQIVLKSIVNSMRMIMISGEQTPEVVEETYRRKLPYLTTLLALADLDYETHALLMMR